MTEEQLGDTGQEVTLVTTGFQTTKEWTDENGVHHAEIVPTFKRLLLNMGAVGASHMRKRWWTPWRKLDESRLIEGSSFLLGDQLYKVVTMESSRDMKVLALGTMVPR